MIMKLDRSLSTKSTAPALAGRGGYHHLRSGEENVDFVGSDHPECVPHKNVHGRSSGILNEPPESPRKGKGVDGRQNTEKLILKCRPAISKSFEKVAWIPDTGSDVEAIDLANFKKMGGSIDMLSPDQDVVRDVTGTPLESLGCCSVVFLHGNDEITSVVHVFEYVNGAYASRRLLKSLKFLPESWPDQEVVQAVCRREQTKETECKLRNEFSDVFDEKNLKPMKGSPMTITLEDNAIPHQERNARNIPVAYEGQVKKQLDDMLDDVIIEWV
eukprot:TCALIF_08240-PA protein Name:"Protein of unknown function" AED:0.20 eAED:0.21 QI:0/0/0/0.25/1/1/4/0/271